MVWCLINISTRSLCRYFIIMQRKLSQRGWPRLTLWPVLISIENFLTRVSLLKCAFRWTSSMEEYMQLGSLHGRLVQVRGGTGLQRGVGPREQQFDDHVVVPYNTQMLNLWVQTGCPRCDHIDALGAEIPRRHPGDRIQIVFKQNNCRSDLIMNLTGLLWNAMKYRWHERQSIFTHTALPWDPPNESPKCSHSELCEDLRDKN